MFADDPVSSPLDSPSPPPTLAPALRLSASAVSPADSDTPVSFVASGDMGAVVASASSERHGGAVPAADSTHSALDGPRVCPCGLTASFGSLIKRCLCGNPIADCPYAKAVIDGTA